MLISLDTNVWIFGLARQNVDCEKILDNLNNFSVLISNQIRAELERNLIDEDIKAFYKVTRKYNSINIDFALVPKNLIENYQRKGLKNGDAEIAAFCEWRGVKIVVSDNRDFLSLIADDLPFEIMSPREFCKKFKL